MIINIPDLNSTYRNGYLAQYTQQIKIPEIFSVYTLYYYVTPMSMLAKKRQNTARPPAQTYRLWSNTALSKSTRVVRLDHIIDDISQKRTEDSTYIIHEVQMDEINEKILKNTTDTKETIIFRFSEI